MIKHIEIGNADLRRKIRHKEICLGGNRKFTESYCVNQVKE